VNRHGSDIHRAVKDWYSVRYSNSYSIFPISGPLHRRIVRIGLTRFWRQSVRELRRSRYRLGYPPLPVLWDSSPTSLCPTNEYHPAHVGRCVHWRLARPACRMYVFRRRLSTAHTVMRQTRLFVRRVRWRLSPMRKHRSMRPSLSTVATESSVSTPVRPCFRRSWGFQVVKATSRRAQTVSPRLIGNRNPHLRYFDAPATSKF
jgi:hypothetical protein